MSAVNVRREVLQLMVDLGGSFASKLGQAWLTADASNSARLALAFPEVYGRYRDLVDQGLVPTDTAPSLGPVAQALGATAYQHLHRAKLAEQQRDELLAALQPFVGRSSSADTVTITVRTADIQRARAAIAKATGSAS